MSKCSVWFCFAAFVWALPSLGADPFAADVRPTEPLSPEQQHKTFHPPPGFEVQLVAGDPDIAKPMNLAFDSRGRLWVTDSLLYPFPAKDVKKDTIKVIELGDDGRAAKITVFADKLDIPIGIYPIGDGSRVIAYDINNVCLYTDTDGDGKSDTREVLYSGWGYLRDTHGMASNFRRGFDGWLYGCHGFNNLSDVKAKDGGAAVHMRSGNTYRMRLDGLRIEMFTIGQINPFGMSMDPLGNIYTSDSHSKPIYQLLRGGRYEAFDRSTDDGLGLAPAMMSHLHGSTAIAGSCFYAADHFPPEYRGNVFVGNVVTSRINRDDLQYTGATPRAVEQPDLLKTDDPWFRPVNTVLGPDGAIYIADFYNRIIGHYEVKLDHPGRDFERGRIWRMVYTGKGSKPAEKVDLSNANADRLVSTLGHPNLAVRMLAMNELSDRIGPAAVEPVTAMLKSAGSADDNAYARIHGLWVLYRLGAATEELIQQAASSTSSAVRVHAMRVLSETHPWTAAHREMAVVGLKDADALIRRCAADALGQHPQAQNVPPLLDLLAQVDPADTHLHYTVRMALRNQLQPADALAKLEELNLPETHLQTIADVSVSIESPESAAFLLRHLGALAKDQEALTRYLRHAMRFSATAPIEPVAKVMQERFADNVDLQLELFRSIRTGLMQRGEEVGEAGRKWGEALVPAALKTAATQDWTTSALNSGEAIVTPWGYERRPIRGGQPQDLLSSLPGGESTTSVLRSRPFELPSKLTFFLAGHNGPPNTDSPPKNRVILRAAGTDEVLKEALPPRHDTAHKVEWDLSPLAGKQAYLEIVDGDTGTGYAWLALGSFDPPVVPMPHPAPRDVQERLRQAASLAGEMKLTATAPDLQRVLLDRACDTDTRAAAADALAALGSDDSVPAMKQVVADALELMPLRDRVAQGLGKMGTPAAQQAIVQSFQLAPRELQTSLAIALTSNTAAAEALLDAVAQGKAPARLLLELGIHDRLAAANVPDLDQRVKQLTRGVFAPQEEVDQLIAERRAAYRSAQPSPPAGEAVFAKNCLACHQVDGNGGVVGPQLVGMSKRGIDRLVEDVLDPNRNVDPAFRYSTLILKNGQLVTGLQKREEGELLVFSDTTGKEVAVEKNRIKQRIESPNSLMPSNFHEIIDREEFNNLMAYLLTK